MGNVDAHIEPWSTTHSKVCLREELMKQPRINNKFYIFQTCMFVCVMPRFNLGIEKHDYQGNNDIALQEYINHGEDFKSIRKYFSLASALTTRTNLLSNFAI